jgi:hypothetical protein
MSKMPSSGSSRAARPSGEADIGRPFEEKVLKKARQIARQYRVVIEPAGRVGGM